MSKINLEYNQSKICRTCGFEVSRMISETTAAFEEYRKWKSACPKCNDLEVQSSYTQSPLLNKN